jgi:DNA-binding response OmpR family regulator
MKKILIIDNNTEIRENTAEILELNNFRVFTAIDGNVGFESAKENMPHVILCDMLLPETGGQKFLLLAKANKGICNIPLIFFSSGSPAHDVHMEAIPGPTSYLKKPFSAEDLLQTIKVVFDR